MDATPYDAEKSALYLRNYDRYFSPLADKEVKVLEIGVRRGGSVQMWRDYFSRGTIIGLDIEPCDIKDTTGRLHLYTGAQQDCALLDRIGNTHAPDGFDIIIDDGSHIGELTRISFAHLFANHLKDGGTYAIEDWATGYWGDWPDGKTYAEPGLERNLTQRILGAHRAKRTILQKVAGRLVTSEQRRRQFSLFRSHSYGLVGVIKELVDELGMQAITDPAHGGIEPHRYPCFRSMEVTVGQVFIVKADEDDRRLMVAQQENYWRSLGRVVRGG